MDDVVNPDPAGEAGWSQEDTWEQEFLRGPGTDADGERQFEGNPFRELPPHRLLAYGRDHGPRTPGLAEAVGEAFAGDMLGEEHSEVQRLAAVRSVGERVLADGRLLGLAPWPEHDEANGPLPPTGCHGRLSSSLGEQLAEGLPLALRVEWFGCGPDGEMTSGVRVDRDRAAEELGMRVVREYELLEAKMICLWNLPRHTPPYLEPREEMRFGQTLLDPALRELVERAWDAMVMLHLTTKANHHPSSREDYRGRWEDAVVDSARLRSLLVKVGEWLFSSGGVSPPEGLHLALLEEFLAKMGEVVVESCYVTGTYRIRTFDALWAKRDWDGLVRERLLSPEEGEQMSMWAARDYRGLLARGFIDAADCEWYERMDAIESGGR